MMMTQVMTVMMVMMTILMVMVTMMVDTVFHNMMHVLQNKPTTSQGLAPGAMTTQANPNVDTTYVEEQEAMLAQVLLLS